MDSNKEELLLCQYRSLFIKDHVSISDAKKFDADYMRSEILGVYMAERGYYHMDHLIDSIVLKAIAKDSIFRENVSLFSALKNSKRGRHTIQINISAYDDHTFLQDIDAYHLSFTDYQVFKRILTMEKRYGSKEEGEEYELVVYSEAKEITSRHCYAGENIGSYESISGNCYSEDCDTYGSTYGSKAQKAFLFWIEYTNEYVVVYFSYWYR
ncbi:hypothetical protein [Brevibacillus reuszeri]|uniref:hypothetical protein n=1 Tax=Brevibacillus reuszeri TaxID=54915 RepID=UPI000CCC9751|nr:hypothetical protein [Brevibacillus reuszeri]